MKRHGNSHLTDIFAVLPFVTGSAVARGHSGQQTGDQDQSRAGTPKKKTPAGPSVRKS